MSYCRKCNRDDRTDFAKYPWHTVCRECYNSYMKEIHRNQTKKVYIRDPEKNRAKNKRHYEAHKEEYRCRAKASWAIKTGRITKEPCRICKSEQAEAHHPNYDNPYNVLWLCRDCHKLIHREDFKKLLEGELNESAAN